MPFNFDFDHHKTSPINTSDELSVSVWYHAIILMMMCYRPLSVWWSLMSHRSALCQTHLISRTEAGTPVSLLSDEGLKALMWRGQSRVDVFQREMQTVLMLAWRLLNLDRDWRSAAENLTVCLINLRTFRWRLSHVCCVESLSVTVLDMCFIVMLRSVCGWSRAVSYLEITSDLWWRFTCVQRLTEHALRKETIPTLTRYTSHFTSYLFQSFSSYKYWSTNCVCEWSCTPV